MDIDDAAGKSVDQEIRDKRQETCQHNELDVILLEAVASSLMRH